MKKVLALTLAVLMIISLFTGCSTTGIGGKNDKVTLRVAWWGSQGRHDATVAALDLYMKNNPNVTIEYEFGGWDGYWDKIAAQAAANDLPNVWQQSVAYLKQYVGANQVIDMQPYVDSGLINLSDWDAASIDAGKVDGKLYSLTMGNTAHPVIYDPEIFAKAGVPEPTMDWTWADYINACDTIYEKLGIPGDSSFPGAEQSGLQHYVFSKGYDYYNADQTAFDFPVELVEEFLQMTYDQQQKGSILDIAVALELVNVEEQPITKGEAGMVSSINSNQLVVLQNACGKQFKMVCLPHAEGEARWGTHLGPSMVINMSNVGTDKDKEESAKLVNFLLNDVEANKILLAERGAPASKAVRDGIIDLLDDAGKKNIEYISAISPNLEPYPHVITPAAGGEIIEIYNRIEEAVLFGQISVKDGAAQFYKEANEALAKKG